MRFKIYGNGVYINTIVADEAFAANYCEKNGFTYEAETLPAPIAEPAPDPQADTDAMLIDHELRLTMLELGI